MLHPSLQTYRMQAWRGISQSQAKRITVNNDTGHFEESGSPTSGDFDQYCNENRRAYVRLFNAIQSDHPHRSIEVMELIKEDIDAGMPLTSKEVTKIIQFLEQNPKEIFGTEWSKLALDYASLSPRTETGEKLIRQFCSSMSEKFLLARTRTPNDKLAVLNTLKEEIHYVSFTSPEVKSKLESLINLHIQRLKFAIKVEQLKVPFLSSMTNPEKDGWRLVLDGKLQDRGIYHFENEQGYMAAMLGGLNLMLDTLEKPLDAQLLCELHDAAVDQVHRRGDLNVDQEKTQESSLLPKNFRNEICVRFGLRKDSNYTQAGFNEFLLSPSKREWSNLVPDKSVAAKTSWDHSVDSELVCLFPPKLILEACQKKEPQPTALINSIKNYYDDIKVPPAVTDKVENIISFFRKNLSILQFAERTGIEVKVEDIQKACYSKADEIITTYHDELAAAKMEMDTAKRETAILTCIAKCCQDLDQHHLFMDANIRTDVFLVMNKLLLQNKLSPAILHEPNAFDMHSRAELVGLIREGQKTFQALTVDH